MQEDRPFRILMADDDEDDCLMVKEALEEASLEVDISFAKDGEDLMDYLAGRGKYSGEKDRPKPGLILLDLNMPRKDGREAIREIKSDPLLRDIPVVAFTTSNSEDDIQKIYDYGGNSFITKPTSFDRLTEVMKGTIDYWFRIVRLPGNIKDD